MSTRASQAVWEGGLKGGLGLVKLGSGNFECAYTFSSRFEEGQGTNPEELIGAALAGCFSMALAHGLEEKGYSPERIDTTARASIEQNQAGFSITRIDLETVAKIPDIDEATFKEQVDAAKTGCPVSQALARERAIISPDKDGEAGDVCFIVDTAGCRQAEKGPLEARSNTPTGS